MAIDGILRGKLRFDNERPLYAQLIDILRQSISSGEVEAGELLPSEAELCKAYGVSRNTVRQAIGTLEEDGFLVRKRGKGTFVADPSARRKLVPHSFTAEVTHMGRSPSSTLISFDVQEASPRIRAMMALARGAKVYSFTRVRNVDALPLIVETSYYPEQLCPGLTRDTVQSSSFYTLLYNVGVAPASVEDSYEAVLLGDREAALLHCRTGTPAFYHIRRTAGEDGRVYEYTTSYIRADRVKLAVHMEKDLTEFTRQVD